MPQTNKKKKPRAMSIKFHQESTKKDNTMHANMPAVIILLHGAEMVLLPRSIASIIETILIDLYFHSNLKQTL